MISTLISFFGGSVFRMIWGELSAFLTKRQDHQYELEHLRLQADLDAQRHARDLERIRLQSDLGVKEVQIKGDIENSRIEIDAWSKLVEDTTRLTGIAFIDAWNKGIRPLLATLAIIAVVAEVAVLHFILSDWHRELIGAILGIFIADRSLAKRGK